MLKLYKSSEGSVRYWEAWEADSIVVLHRGVVGDTGETMNLQIGPGESGESIIEREAAIPRNQGFSEIPLELHSELVVQYRLANWGSPADLEKRHGVQDLLDDTLGWTGNGHCDGGDIGSGSINAYSFVVDPEKAAEAVIDALERDGMLAGAVIAVRENADYRVLWPRDYDGKFSVI
jgi:hypothetical protein